MHDKASGLSILLAAIYPVAHWEQPVELIQVSHCTGHEVHKKLVSK